MHTETQIPEPWCINETTTMEKSFSVKLKMLFYVCECVCLCMPLLCAKEEILLFCCAAHLLPLPEYKLNHWKYFNQKNFVILLLFGELLPCYSSSSLSLLLLLLCACSWERSMHKQPSYQQSRLSWNWRAGEMGRNSQKSTGRQEGRMGGESTSERMKIAYQKI